MAVRHEYLKSYFKRRFSPLLSTARRELCPYETTQSEEDQLDVHVTHGWSKPVDAVERDWEGKGQMSGGLFEEPVRSGGSW